MTKDSAPFVTVIMNCYNSATYLAEAIDSVCKQTFSDWEIVFWDNQSSDESPKIVQRYADARIRYFRAETHTVLGAARNLALAQARGEWIALLDCDDFWHPQKLERQVALIRANPKLALVYSDMNICNAEGKIIDRGSRFYTMRRGSIWTALLTQRNFIPCPAAMFNTARLREVGPFRPDLRFVEEYELFLRIVQDAQADYIEEPLVNYRVYAGNTTGRGTRETTDELIGVLRCTLRNRPRGHTIPWVRMLARLSQLYLKRTVQSLAELRKSRS